MEIIKGEKRNSCCVLRRLGVFEKLGCRRIARGNYTCRIGWAALLFLFGPFILGWVEACI